MGRGRRDVLIYQPVKVVAVEREVRECLVCDEDTLLQVHALKLAATL